MQELEKHAECRIPHRVQARGVVIETTCGTPVLRLTEDHLVFTSTGLRAASELTPSDIVFSDEDQSATCRVLRVSKEATDQRNFGLNCLHSEVLANGVKCSTFGKYHFIPSTWMSWTGRLIGVERASRWGDAIAVVLAKARLI